MFRTYLGTPKDVQMRLFGGKGKGGLPTQLVNLFPDHRLRRSLESIAAEECWDQRSIGESRVSDTPPKSKAY